MMSAQVLNFKDNNYLMAKNGLFPLKLGIMLETHFPAIQDKTRQGMTNICCQLTNFHWR